MIPNVSSALNGWTKKQTITKITKIVVDHEVSEVSESFIVDMNLQPTPPEIVNRKPEEQRSWKWFNIFTKTKIKLNIDDRILVSGTYYRIQEIKDWNQSGYYEYEAIEDFNQSEETPTT